MSNRMTEDEKVGLCCMICGDRFKREHGYPVICKDCASEFDADEDFDDQIAIYEKVYNK